MKKNSIWVVKFSGLEFKIIKIKIGNKSSAPDFCPVLSIKNSKYHKKNSFLTISIFIATSNYIKFGQWSFS